MGMKKESTSTNASRANLDQTETTMTSNSSGDVTTVVIEMEPGWV
jgi:hypothetical protein